MPSRFDAFLKALFGPDPAAAHMAPSPLVGTTQNPTPRQEADSPPVGTSQNPDALLVAYIDYQTLAPGICQYCRQKSWERLSRFVMYSDIRPPARMHDREARLEALDRMAQQVARQQERGHFKAVTRTRTCTSCLNDTLHQLGLPDGSIEGLRRMDWDEGYEPATRFAVFAHFTHGIDVVNVPSIVGLDEDEALPSALADARAEGAPSDERRGAASDPGGGDSALEAAHRRWIYLWAQRNAERFGQDPVKLGPAAFNFSYERRWRDPVLGDITAPGGPGAQTLRARILRDGLRLQAAAPTPDAAAILGTTPFTHDYDVLAAVGRVPPERLQAAGLGDLWDLHEAYDKRETVVRGLIEAWLLGQLQSGINVTATLTQAGMAAQVESCLRDTLHTSRASS